MKTIPKSPGLTGRAVAMALGVMLSVSMTVRAGQPNYLGPIGVMGDTQEKQIVVSSVESGSPAEGKLEKGDVILAVNGKPFVGNSRMEMAVGIDAAESHEAGGMLTLTIKSKTGQQRDIELKVKTFGTYADSAPYDCEKTDAIVTASIEQMIQSQSYHDGLATGYLALMATGEPRYLDVVKAEMPKEAWYTPDPEKMQALLRGEVDMGLVAWYWGYQTIAMAEYYLLTGDTSALSGLETYALTMAQGQDPAGLWGHRMATDARGGRLPGYSHINQPSMTCFLGLILARKCGIQHPDLDAAIARTHNQLQRYVGRGALPYGNHPPRTKSFNNNGSSASAAIAMSLLDDDRAARFFSQQSGASHQDIEKGHASHYFNIIWTPLGTNVAGPEITKKFFDEIRWLHTLSRSWKDNFTYNGQSHKAVNTSASHLLAYCIPRQQLIITGRDADTSRWVSKDTADDIMGWSRIDYANLTDAELLELIDHPAPQVRIAAVWTLRQRDPEFIPKFAKLMETGTDTQQQSVLGFFGYQCPTEVAAAYLDRMAKLLRDEDESDAVRVAAANAISWHGELAEPYFKDILAFAVEPRSQDPQGEVLFELRTALSQMSQDAFERGIVTNKALYYQAANTMADHVHQNCREVAMQMLRGMPIEDFYIVADRVKKVARNREPDSTAYHNPNGPVSTAVLILADFGIKEGMDWAVETLDTPDGKWSFKVRAVMSSLPAYGPHVKPYIEAIQADEKLLNMVSHGRFAKLWDQVVKASLDDPAKYPALISFEQAKAIGTKHGYR